MEAREVVCEWLRECVIGKRKSQESNPKVRSQWTILKYAKHQINQPKRFFIQLTLIWFLDWDKPYSNKTYQEINA